MNIRLLLLLAFATIGERLSAQPDTIISSLVRDVPTWMEQNHVPCVGIGIIESGKIKWAKVFGNVQQNHPAPGNTLFNIASQTKPVTAMLAMKLVQAGLWNLDEPLSHYWTDPDLAGDPRLERLTTRLVVSHQTGFPNWRTDNGGQKLRFIADPGTKFGYSGEGFEYLRRAIESKFHQSLGVLLATYLTGPQHLDDTYYWHSGLDTTRFAMWHDGQGHRYSTSIQTAVSGADDLITTVEDYCRFGIYTMNGLGLPDTLFDEMVRPQVKVKENYYRCLGWGLVTGLMDGGYALEHGGSDIGVRTMAIFLPKSKAGIVVLTNGDNGLFINDLVIKRALPLGEQVLATMNKGASVHTRITLPDAVIQSHAGAYVQQNGKVIHIEKQGNSIKVSGDGAPTAVLYPESSTKFFLDGYDVQMEFPDDSTLIIYEGGKQVMKIRRQADDVIADLKKDMSAIASDSTEGRFTGSAGYKRAADYVAAQLHQAGLKTSLQPVPFTWDDYTGTTLTVHGKTYSHDPKNFIVLHRGKGPAIVLFPDSDQSKDWETTVLRQYRFGYMHYQPDGLPDTSGATTILVSPILAKECSSRDRYHVIFRHRSRSKTGYNVIASMSGTDTARSHETILITAHLDHIGRVGEHIYNGANDDASGCAAAMAAARKIALAPCKRPLLFVFFCGEELDLKGSRWFVDHTSLPAGDMYRVVNLEQLGSKHRSFSGVWALGDTLLMPAFQAAASGGMSTQFSAIDTVGDILRNTDTYPFIVKHIPALLLGSGSFEEHHRTSDTIDLIDFDHLREAADVLSRLLMILANQPVSARLSH